MAADKWHRDVSEMEEISDVEWQKQRRQKRLKHKRRDKKRIEEPLFDDRFYDEEDEYKQEE